MCLYKLMKLLYAVTAYTHAYTTLSMHCIIATRIKSRALWGYIAWLRAPKKDQQSLGPCRRLVTHTLTLTPLHRLLQ